MTQAHHGYTRELALIGDEYTLPVHDVDDDNSLKNFDLSFTRTDLDATHAEEDVDADYSMRLADDDPTTSEEENNSNTPNASNIGAILIPFQGTNARQPTNLDTRFLSWVAEDSLFAQSKLPESVINAMYNATRSDGVRYFNLPRLNGYTAEKESYNAIADLYERERSLLRLSLLCFGIGAPLYAFEKFQKWAVNSGHSTSLLEHGKITSRKAFVKEMEDMCGLKPPTVTTIEIEYPSRSLLTEKRVSIVTLDFKQQLFKVLNDPRLTAADNLVVNDALHPYDSYIPNPYADEIQDGIVFQNAQKKLRVDDSIDLVIGVILYADASHTDVFGRNNVEPVLATLSIFNRATRNKAESNICLGMITDLGLKSSARKQIENNRKFPGVSCRNYHRQLKHILSDLQLIQHGFFMELCLAGISQVRRIILPIVMVKGDGKSQDMMCGRYGGYSLHGSRCSWKCDCPTIKADSFTLGCKVLHHEEIRRLSLLALGKSTNPVKPIPPDIQAIAANELKSISQYAVELFSFDTLIADDIHGIFGITPVCCLHTINGGVCVRLHDNTIGRLGPTQKAFLDSYSRSIFRGTRQGMQADLPPINHKRGISDMKRISNDERLGVSLCTAIFSRIGIGLYELTVPIGKLRLDDVPTRARELKLLLNRDDDLVSHNHIENIGYCKEMLACFEAWLMSHNPKDTFWNPHDPEARETGEAIALQAIRTLQQTIFYVAPILHSANKIGKALAKNNDCSAKETEQAGAVSNDTNLTSPPLNEEGAEEVVQELSLSSSSLSTEPGDNNEDDSASCDAVVAEGPVNGHKYQKFHNLSHLPLEISLFGSPLNFDTSTNEHHHIHFVKKTAKLTKKHDYVDFLTGVGQRIHENILFDACHFKLIGDEMENVGTEEPSTEEASTTHGHKDIPVVYTMTGLSFHIALHGLDIRDTPAPADTPPTQRTRYIHGWGHAEVRSENTRSKFGFDIPQAVMNYIRQFFYHELNTTFVEGRTEMKRTRNGRHEALRAHSNFQGGGPWADWVMVEKKILDYYMSSEAWKPPMSYNAKAATAASQRTEARNEVASRFRPRRAVPVVNYAETTPRQRVSSLHKMKTRESVWKSILEACVPCRICCFIERIRDTRKLPPGSNLSTSNAFRHDTESYAVLRLSDTEPVDLQGLFDSVLLDRWEKIYYDDGNPVFAVIPVKLLGDRVFVINDFDAFFENRNGFEERRQTFIDGDKEVCYGRNGKKKITRQRRKACEDVPVDALACDWVYTLWPLDTWPCKFFQLKGNYPIRRDQMGKVCSLV